MNSIHKAAALVIALTITLMGATLATAPLALAGSQSSLHIINPPSPRSWRATRAPLQRIQKDRGPSGHQPPALTLNRIRSSRCPFASSRVR